MVNFGWSVLAPFRLEKAQEHWFRLHIYVDHVSAASFSKYKTHDAASIDFL
jgi:hypothetical protein